MTTSATAHYSSVLYKNQRGAASVAIVMLLMFILAAAVGAMLNMSSSSVVDAAKNEEQVAALFLAESGLERAQGILQAAADPTVGSTCTGIAGSNFTLDRGKFNLSATPTGCDGSNLNCTSCKITSTGLGVGSASRTITRIMTLSAPSGGAKGCGGGGTTPPLAACTSLSPTVPIANQSQYIDQNIAVTATNSPAILLSNVAYARHPQGNSNSVETNTCVAAIGSTNSKTCISQWNDQSASNNGSNVVGSQGASVGPLTNLGTYTLRQSLTKDSLFAAVGMIASGANIDLVGSSVTNSSASYWDDLTSGNTSATVSGNGSGSGQTNDGSWCNFSSGSCTSATTINGATFSQKQTSNSWCYDGDTLVFGLSGSSNNNATGALTSFTFGTSPASTAVPNGTAIYPSIHTNNTQVFSSLRYLYNPYFSTANDATSGMVVTGTAGAAFSGKLFNGTKQMDVTGLNLTTMKLSVGDTVSGSNALGGAANTSKIDVAPAGNQDGTYTLRDNSSASPTASLTATSNLMYVSLPSINTPALATVGDTIYCNGLTCNAFPSPAGLTVNSVSGTGGNGTVYGFSGVSRRFGGSLGAANSSTITSNGTTVTASAPITTIPANAALTVGTPLAIRSGTGTLAAGTNTVASYTDTRHFNLSQRPATPLSGANVCGGICAYFNHGAAATTNFTVGVSNTSQWAAGMTCLKGVDTSTIQGLTGTSAGAKATTWHEVVN